MHVSQHVIDLRLVLRLFISLEQVRSQPLDGVQIGFRAVVQLV